MKKHLDLFRALVAFIVFGNAASRSLQIPVQAPQRDFSGPGVGLGAGPGNPGGGFGGGAGEGPQGLFGETFNDRPSGGVGTGPAGSLGVGAAGRRPGGFPGGRADILTGSGPGDGSFGRSRDGGLGSFGQGGATQFGRGPGLSGRLRPGALPGSQGELGSPSRNLQSIGSGLGPMGNSAGNAFGSGRTTPGQRGSGQGLPGGVPSPSGTLQDFRTGLSPSASPSGNLFGSDLGAPEQRGPPLGPSTTGFGLSSERERAGSSAIHRSGGIPSFPNPSVPFPRPSTTLGGGSDGFNGPAAAPPGAGGFDGGSATGPGIYGSGGAAPFGPPSSSPGAPGTETSVAGQPGMGSSLPAPAGSGVGQGTGVLPSNEIPSSSGISGARGTGVTGAPGVLPNGPQGVGPGATSRLPAGRGGSGPHRPGKPRGALNPVDAAAIGLGVGSGLLALSALAAGIASHIQQKKHRTTPLVKPTAGCVGGTNPPRANAQVRSRRSIPESKVPAEVLDSISMNFERLY